MSFDPDATRQLRAHYADEIAGLKRQAARRRRMLRAAGAAVAACMALGAAIFTGGWHEVAAPAKAPRTVALADGSRVHLDAGAVIELPWAPWRHRVRLLQGIALFEVEHDDDRRFVVEIARTEVTDLGTRFLVEQRDDGARVAVFDGKVDIATRSGRHAELAPGQAAHATADAVTPMPMPDEAEATDWRDGRLVFRAAPLAEVAAKLSRYGDRPVVVGAPSLAALKVSGTFRLDDGDGALSTLERALPIRARRAPDRIDLLPR